MRFLVLGAGALGGYFGGRLLEAGRDVTFVLRPRRAAEIDTHGLVIESPFGDVRLSPSHTLAGPYDVILLGCKAYDLDAAMDTIAPAVGPGTAILPLLNGLSHLERLTQRFGAEHVLGGQCQISAALGPNGAIQHLNDSHRLAFGEPAGGLSPRVEAIAAACAGAKFECVPSDNVLLEMWEKWAFIAALAGITCLLRGAVGDIASAGATPLALVLYEECGAIAAHNGYATRAHARERATRMLATTGSLLTASMLKDLERGAPTEGEHLLGDLLARGGPTPTPLLEVATAHLRTYEARRKREAVG